MPLVLARVDNRLLHGQILSAWMPALDARAVVVADDATAGSPLARRAMALAVPPDVGLEIASLDGAPNALARVATRPTVLLMPEVASAVALVDAGLSLEQLNLGNVHYRPDRRLVTQSVYLSPDEVDALAWLEQRGIRIELRTLPGERPLLLADIRRQLEVLR